MIVYTPVTLPSSLSIPSLSLTTPVVIGRSTDNNILHQDLDSGAVFYPGSVMPGKAGQIIILGHSAPPNWPRIKHDYIFSQIEDLNRVTKLFYILTTPNIFTGF